MYQALDVNLLLIPIHGAWFWQMVGFTRANGASINRKSIAPFGLVWSLSSCELFFGIYYIISYHIFIYIYLYTHNYQAPPAHGNMMLPKSIHIFTVKKPSMIGTSYFQARLCTGRQRKHPIVPPVGHDSVLVDESSEIPRWNCWLLEVGGIRPNWISLFLLTTTDN